MPRYVRHAREYLSWRTLREALEEAYDGEHLKALARRLEFKGLTRKADIAQAISSAMLKDETRLRDIWDTLDDIQQKAVAETLHGAEGYFNGARFQAKYGEYPPLFRRRESAARNAHPPVPVYHRRQGPAAPMRARRSR